MSHEWVDIAANPDSAALKVKLEGDLSFLSEISFGYDDFEFDNVKVSGDADIEHTVIFPSNPFGLCEGDYPISFLDNFSCNAVDQLIITRSKLSVQVLKPVLSRLTKFPTNNNARYSEKKLLS